MITLGVDSAEGGDRSAFAVSNEKRLIELLSKKTPDTSLVPDEIESLMRQYDIEPSNVLLDRGGGGTQHADQLRRRGHKGIRTIGFGESVTDTKKEIPPRYKSLLTKVEIEEMKYTCKNRRAEMYWLTRLIMKEGWGIPRPDPKNPDCPYARLVFQMKKIPLSMDGEGRIYLLPKRAKPGSKEDCLEKLIGYSPDELDAVVLSVFGQFHPGTRRVGLTI